MRWKPVLLAAALGACGDGHATPDAPAADTPMSDAAADAAIDANPNMPATLMDTGLCLDAACTQISPDVKAYTPRWQLWSDGATKKRWIYLPPGTQIDTSDMDYWQFPVGTKIWKEFTRDNIRVETRLIMRIGSGTTVNDWFYVPYVWNQAQDATTAEPFGVVDANGTQHDVPSRQQCKTCHENLQPTRILGFSALQLDYDNADPYQLDLQAAIDAGLLTNPPATTTSPHFPLPADAPSTAVPALGYLHANCGHCHNPSGGAWADSHMVLRLDVSETDAATTQIMQTTVGAPLEQWINHGYVYRIVAGDPAQSALLYRMTQRTMYVQMPPLATEHTDDAGIAAIQSWIQSL